MIIHCTTQQQIEDVIKTESMNMYASPEKIFKSYGSNSCINNGSYGSLDFYKSYGYTITPYVDWKLHKLIDESERIELSIVEGAHASTILNRLERQREIAKEMVEISKQLRYQDGKEGIIKFEKENEMKDQFIQLEGGKLNITKARELGLFVEDKRVFTVDKDCEIKYGEYNIESYESLGLGRCVCISDRTSKHVVIINPTPDKVRHEFAYYGIEVDVYDR